MTARPQPGDIHAFWFSERARPLWFEKSPAFDSEIRDRFGPAVQAAQQGDFAAWEEDPLGALALLILIDQMARNIHRGSAAAFLGDPRARAVADAAIARGFDRRFSFAERRFFYLPFEHGETRADQDRAIALFANLLAEAAPENREAAAEQLHYAHLHRDIILRFGRFPHRNAALGRETTPEEAEFLKGPNSSF